MTPALITAAISAAIALIEYIGKAREAISQDKEWTEAERAAIDEKIALIPTLSHWQVKD